MSWRTFWKLTLAMTLAVIVGGLTVRAVWFSVVMERLIP